MAVRFVIYTVSDLNGPVTPDPSLDPRPIDVSKIEFHRQNPDGYRRMRCLNANKTEHVWALAKQKYAGKQLRHVNTVTPTAHRRAAIIRRTSAISNSY